MSILCKSRSDHVHPAVHMQSFTRDVSCFVGCQECNRVGDFLCAAEATRRNLRQDTRTLVIAQRTCHVRFNKARSNNVYSNTA
ncbi:Uncharacterised protein [Klebsiella pneumoniae]|uniref:Uncharacterized protein n=1 Tax=Klebsiella pneumoniae TaxID=573 RepID=A0ABD7NXH1_KLEPN|nr:Uncharacterised protein [Klebsiella pneumoniae]